MSHPRNEAPEECTVEECKHPVLKAGLCRGHYRRKEDGRPIHGPLREYGEPRRALMEAAFAFADASTLDDEAYERAWKRLYRAAKRA